ncbi:SDR family oxidoreductase [Rhizobium leguminosarum]|uniref:SDR family oxidoreductase n=1 Tax=Rhizobium leguminosarum TaxID=384 RepID=UPI001FE10966|nr:SDR family oxidoreductase [Rhizobium leguminosarum]
MTRLANKVSLVIGGVGGIGGAVSQRFASEGAQVYATSRKGAESQPDLAGMGSIHTIQADASNNIDLQRVFEEIRSEQGRIDVLVVNAGLSEYALLGDISEDHFDRTFGLNVRSLVFATREAIDLMQPGGAIVLIGSIAGDCSAATKVRQRVNQDETGQQRWNVGRA